MNDMDMNQIGNEMKRLRTAHGYTQEKVARDLSCTVAYISNIEHNRVRLNLRVLMYYAETFGVTVDSIINTGRADPADNYSHNARDTELLNIFHTFPDKDQDNIIKILKYTSELV